MTADRAAWLEWRRQGIGASDVAAILGLSPWGSAWSVWVDKTGLATSKVDDEMAERFEFGHAAEDMLLAYFERRTHERIDHAQLECVGPESWMRATPDGVVLGDGGTARRVVDAKTDPSRPWDEIPVYYQCQGQWQMAVTGAEVATFVVLHMAFGRPLVRLYDLERDDAEIALLIARCRTFWFDHVLTGDPPPVDGSQHTTDAISQAYADAATEDVVASDEDRYAVARINELKAQIAEWEKVKAEHENALRVSLGGATRLVYNDTDGRTIVLATWNPSERTTVDTKALRERLPRVAGRFTKTTPTRTLLVKNPKE